MRLIDADAFIEYLGLDAENSREDNLGEIVTLEDFDRHPTAYDVDKVVEQLEDMRSKREEQLRSCADNDMADYLRCKMSAIAEVIEIVKSGGIE